MGTRSLTVFKQEDGQEIAVLYRQHDGYYEGHGKELVKFLKDKKITNGISGKDTFNGMNCLTASVIAYFKDSVGGFYLYPAGRRDINEEYIYTVSGKAGDNQATIEMYDFSRKRIILKPKLENEKVGA